MLRSPDVLTARLLRRHRPLLWLLPWSLSVAALGTLLAGCGGGDDPEDERLGESQEASVCASGAVVHGIDVSVWQGSIDWGAVKSAGKHFAIARISDGTYMDTKFDANWAGMKEAGIVRGAYQFFEPGEDPVAQANLVVSKVGQLGAGDLPVTADMEVTGSKPGATIAQHLQTWVSHVKAGTGKAPMIYTAPGWWNSNVGSTAFGNLPLWVANWGVSCRSMPAGWDDWKMWQHGSARGDLRIQVRAPCAEQARALRRVLRRRRGGRGLVRRPRPSRAGG